MAHRARALVDREPRERELTGMQLRERRAGESVKAHAQLEDNAGVRVVRGPQLPQEQSDYVEFHDDYHLYNQTQSQQPGGKGGRVAHMHTPNRHVGQVVTLFPMLGASQSLCYWIERLIPDIQAGSGGACASLLPGSGVNRRGTGLAT